MTKHSSFERGESLSVGIEKERLVDFFSNRPGLCVDTKFQERILTPALTMSSVMPAMAGASLNLSEPMTDADLIEKLGGRIFQDPLAFCLYLANALELQWSGVEGNLNNGYEMNVFYVRGLDEVFGVVVNYDTDEREWFVNACRLGGSFQTPGRRVFPCNS